jgi:fructosamine-3-kinase
VEYRLKEQAELGQENGWFNRDFLKLFLEKEPKISRILSETSSTPSLLHGDLWSGNVHWSKEGAVLIDPAVYFGHREADLAFLGLFDDPGEIFWSIYNSELPIEEGFEIRKHILNLYHLMTHSNLFGGSYIQTVWKVLHAI